MHNTDTIPTDGKSWSEVTSQAPDWQFRINQKRGVVTLWRNNKHPMFYGNHQIQTIPLDTKLAREWLDAAGYDTFALNMASKY